MSNSPISSNGIDSKDESWLLLLSDPSAEKANMRSKLVFFSCCTLMTMIPAIAALVLYPLGQVFAALISLILAGAGLAQPWVHQIGLASLWAAAVLTVITGWDYLRVGMKHMD